MINECLPVAREKSPWLFGMKQATALDGHVAVIVNTLVVDGRRSLVPLEISEYLGTIFEVYGDR